MSSQLDEPQHHASQGCCQHPEGQWYWRKTRCQLTEILGLPCFKGVVHDDRRYGCRDSRHLRQTQRDSTPERCWMRARLRWTRVVAASLPGKRDASTTLELRRIRASLTRSLNTVCSVFRRHERTNCTTRREVVKRHCITHKNSVVSLCFDPLRLGGFVGPWSLCSGRARGNYYHGS